jgi:hypothetical protein
MFVITILTHVPPPPATSHSFFIVHVKKCAENSGPYLVVLRWISIPRVLVLSIFLHASAAGNWGRYATLLTSDIGGDILRCVLL